MTVTSTDARKFQEIIEAKQSELCQVPRRRTDIAIERSPDQMDEVQYAAERELAIRNLDRESGLLRELNAALQRIDDGTFGNCIQCESAITSKRLAAVPWAAYCLHCQEEDDLRHANGASPSELAA